MPGPYGGQSQQRWGDNTINANEYLRDIMMTDLSGRPTGTSDARRKGMCVLTFFDTASPVSRELLPVLQKLADVYKESGKVTVLGVSLNDRAETKALVDALGIKFPVMTDADRYHAMVYGLTAFPTTFLADGTGLVLRKLIGYRPNILNEMSAAVATFAAVEPIDLFAPPAPPPEPVPAAA
ncbi:MAG: TlpA disulfide reductase family protein [Capsulimonadales bacterium]|nr:TlpA disulfide reductase family protein [Capsulimonadales bacterium]